MDLGSLPSDDESEYPNNYGNDSLPALVNITSSTSGDPLYLRPTRFLETVKMGLATKAVLEKSYCWSANKVKPENVYVTLGIGKETKNGCETKRRFNYIYYLLFYESSLLCERHLGSGIL